MTILRKDINKPLTPQQLAFINFFVDSLNPTESVKKAGYSKEDAKRRAKELLQNPRIIQAINDKIEASAHCFAVNKAFFAKKLLEIIDSTTKQEEVLDRSGNPTGKYKLNDAGSALRALEALSRCYSSVLSAEKADNGGMKILCIENLDENKI